MRDNKVQPATDGAVYNDRLLINACWCVRAAAGVECSKSLGLIYFMKDELGTARIFCID